MLLESFAWLSTPISGATEHLVSVAVSWHGRLMVIAWGLLVPLAVLMARFFKVTPRQDWPAVCDNPLWWHIHRLFNYGAVLAGSIAVWLVWRGDGGRVSDGGVRDLHVLCGWTIMVLALLQVLGGLARGSKGGPSAPRLNPDGTVLDLHGDHYAMTRRRIAFERLHKAMGYCVLVLAMGTIAMGLWISDAPRWMWLAIVGWWSVLLAWAWSLQARGYCLDTYQAIWGTDPALPGASAGPVGWGVRKAAHVAGHAGATIADQKG